MERVCAYDFLLLVPRVTLFIIYNTRSFARTLRLLKERSRVIIRKKVKEKKKEQTGDDHISEAELSSSRMRIT